jgi:hypothetical protein
MTEWQVPAPKWVENVPLKTWMVVGLTLIALQAATLLAMGQPLICACGYVKLWHGVVQSPETSQHLTDWYTPSHIIHGVLFYAGLWLLAPQLPVGMRFALAMGLEASWEVFENTEFAMDRYRQGALAQGYFGDSVINSAFDTLAAAGGFLIARLAPLWATVALVIGMELIVGGSIRDNLMLNIIQFLYPTAAVSQWQTGG